MSISWPLERSKDEAVRATLGKRFLTRLWLTEWLVLIHVSVILALAASLISVYTAWLATLREGYCRDRWYITRQACSDWADWPHGVQWLVYIGLSVLLATIAGLLVRYAPNASMSGIHALNSYFQGFDIPNLMAVKTIFTKLCGLALVSASGLWLGQEAPLVYISSASTAVVSRFLPISEARVRDLAMASTAAGISVAFSAPVGGVIFALEVFIPSKEVVWRMFVCSMVATVVLQSMVAPSSASGGIVVPETGLFRVTYDRVWHAVEIVPFALLGILGGLFGSMVSWVASVPNGIYSKWSLLSVVAMALVTAVFGYLNVVSRVPASELLASLFVECRPDNADHMLCKDQHVGGIIYTLVLACVFFPLSITLEVPSGTLFPSLVTGALLGRLVGLVMQGLLEQFPEFLGSTFCPDKSQHCITPGAYALVGAGAVLTGVTRLTVSSVVLMFEITGALSYIVPIMTGVIISKWVVDTFGKSRGIMEQWYSREKYPHLPDSLATIPDLYASEIMVGVDSVVAVRGNAAVPPPITSRYKSVPILGADGEFLDLYSTSAQQSEPTIILTPKATLRLVVSSMTELGVRTVIICSSGKFRGLISRRDVISVLGNSRPVVTAADAAEFEIESDGNDYASE